MPVEGDFVQPPINGSNVKLKRALAAPPPRQVGRGPHPSSFSFRCAVDHGKLGVCDPCQWSQADSDTPYIDRPTCQDIAGLYPCPT